MAKSYGRKFLTGLKLHDTIIALSCRDKYFQCMYLTGDTIQTTT